MKRLLIFIAVLAIALLASTSLIMAQAGIPSVPNLVNFQGKLTTPAGNPVADGPHSFVFRIYDDPAVGALQWSEGPLAIATTGGLFTHPLGSSTTLPVSLFEDFDSLYLEVEADGSIITPRTRLIAGPYTKVASGLDGRNFADSTYIKTFPAAHQLSTFGDDGQEQIRLWGPSWGEILLHDNAPTNNTTATLTANAASGGELRLGPTAGGTTIDLHGGFTGDASAVFPSGAVNAIELLNEPGIASESNSPTVALATMAVTTTDSVTITTPTPGFIVVIADGLIEYDHIKGTTDVFRGSISSVAGVHDFDNIILDHFPDSNSTETANLYHPFSRTKFEAVGVGTYTYYLTAEEFSGGVNILRRHMVAMFFPTAYGPVVSTVASKPGLKPALVDGSDLPPSEVKVITAEQHQTQAAVEQAKQIADLKARIKKLEEAAKQGKQQATDE